MSTEVVYTVQVVTAPWPLRVRAALCWECVRRRWWLARRAWEFEPRPWRGAQRRRYRELALEIIQGAERLADEYLLFGRPQ